MTSLRCTKHDALVLYELDRCPLCVSRSKNQVLAQRVVQLESENAALRGECKALIAALERRKRDEAPENNGRR
ncbi:MAG: hypothetical protein HY650_09780 [Acidobacteria bacterium]|nr:hypothetical protein [Acidobacteriota bacterium]